VSHVILTVIALVIGICAVSHYIYVRLLTRAADTLVGCGNRSKHAWRSLTMWGIMWGLFRSLSGL